MTGLKDAAFTAAVWDFNTYPDVAFLSYIIRVLSQPPVQTLESSYEKTAN